MNVAGASAKPMLVYDSFARSRPWAAETIAASSRPRRGRRADAAPPPVELGVRPCEPEVRGHEVAVGAHTRLELLEMRERARVDGARERRLQRLAPRERGRGERTLVQQHLEPAVSRP